MNEIAARVSRVGAAICGLLACLVSALHGAGFSTVLLRATVAFFAGWVACELAARLALRTLLRRVVEDQKPSRIDVTLE